MHRKKRKKETHTIDNGFKHHNVKEHNITKKITLNINAQGEKTSNNITLHIIQQTQLCHKTTSYKITSYLKKRRHQYYKTEISNTKQRSTKHYKIFGHKHTT